MTFAFHHYSGAVLGILIARLLGIDSWTLGVLGFIIGGYADTASWVLWKFWKWERWEYHGWSHPPYDAVSGHGRHDRYGKWIPFWFQHTWLIDSIVHPTAPKVLFPKFDPEWANTTWVAIWPSHWNIRLTKWDVLYGVLEGSLWILYTLMLLFLK